MDINEYLTGEANYERFKLYNEKDINGNNVYTEDERQVQEEKYDEPTNINVREEGGTHWFRNLEGAMELSELCYWSNIKIKARDKINGQYVRYTKYINDFDMSFMYCEAYM